MLLGLVYAWSLFAEPLEAEFGWTRMGTSLVFTVSMVCLSLGHLSSGWLLPRTSPRVVLGLSAVCACAGFLLSSLSASLGQLVGAYGVLCGLAVGLGANCVMASALRFFPRRQGTVSGVLLAGVGLGPLLLGPLVSAAIAGWGWRAAMMGLAAASVVLLPLGALVLGRSAPEDAASGNSVGKVAGKAAGKETVQSESAGGGTSGVRTARTVASRDAGRGGTTDALAQAAREADAWMAATEGSAAPGPMTARAAVPGLPTARMVRTREFWLLFAWMVLLASAGLALISNAAPAVTDVLAAAGEGSAAAFAATGAVGILSGFNAVGRLAAGRLWDTGGARRTMTALSGALAVAMALCALAVVASSFALVVAGFLLLGMVYGGTVSVGSAFTARFFGMAHYALNYAVVSTNMMAASLVGPTIAGASRTLADSYLPAYVVLLAFAVISLALARTVPDCLCGDGTAAAE